MRCLVDLDFQELVLITHTQPIINILGTFFHSRGNSITFEILNEEVIVNNLRSLSFKFWKKQAIRDIRFMKSHAVTTTTISFYSQLFKFDTEV